MLQETFNPINSNVKQTSKPKQNVLSTAISNLKSQNSALKSQITTLRQQAIKQKKKHEEQINIYKKKIITLNQKDIVNSLMGNTADNSLSLDHGIIEQKFKRTTIQNQQLQRKLKNSQHNCQQLKESVRNLEKIAQRLELEKNKNMEISIREKIQMENKYNLSIKEIASKKTIIEALNKEIQKFNSFQADLYNRERKITQRSKQMQQYQNQFAQYFKQSQTKYIQRIKGLEKQNIFLKKRIQKILKNIRTKCKCQGEASEWKDKVHRLGRELVKTRVELSKVMFEEERKGNNKNKKVEDGSESNDSLELSMDSDDDKQKTQLIKRNRC